MGGRVDAGLHRPPHDHLFVADEDPSRDSPSCLASDGLLPAGARRLIGDCPAVKRMLGSGSTEGGDMARLKLGFIPIEGGKYYREALDEVTRAEELGLDSVWMEEHHSVTNHYWPSPLTVLAGFATRTSRMMLGTDIVVAAFHHPVRLAEDVAMLDVMSGGRITLGIAIGYKPDEFALYGVELEKRGARFEEQLAIMKALWTQERVSFKGTYYTRPSGSAAGATSPSDGRPRWPTTGSLGRPPISSACSQARSASSRTGRPPGAPRPSPNGP
ncbi:MAG: hypothetical protein DME05_14870 [Candidatus Rokuibacteriota bacterium]|nr:MAG: hypothetical protein DME05_14870 [Candidatus Rokubacteria bacterium]